MAEVLGSLTGCFEFQLNSTICLRILEPADYVYKFAFSAYSFDPLLKIDYKFFFATRAKALSDNG